jgi:hypothetical protein
MGRAVSIIYGAILIWLAIEAFFDGGAIPNEFLPFAVLIMGFVILFTPISRAGLPLGFAPQRRGVDMVRRWLFGIALVLMGLGSFENVINFAPFLQNLAVGSTSGALILGLIAVVYFLSSFARTRNIQVAAI